MVLQGPPARKVHVFYWRSAKKSHWYNQFVPEMEKLIEYYDIERLTRLKPLDFQFLNINRSDERNMDYHQFASLIDRYRSKKRRKYPLMVLDDTKLISIESSADLRYFDNLLAKLSEYYLG